VRQTAVLARVEQIEPQDDGGGKLRHRGPFHLFDGDEFHNHAGRIKAWCGTTAATVDLRAVEDRARWKAPLWADLCRRCFQQPRNKLVEP
jgi:hypothetical protein